MPFFSRLTDIVTCNLSSILAQAENPETALGEIIHEMQEGVAGAQRSVKTAGHNVARIESEIHTQREEAQRWLEEAKTALSSGADAQARMLLTRKHEVEDLIAGLEQQLQAAVSTRDHLQTTLHALEARLADARRRQAGGSETETTDVTGATVDSRQYRVDVELEALRQQLQQ